MFVRGKLIQSGAVFDEGLGVGTPIGGAEDTEFALRAHILATQTMYLDAAVIGHRDKNPAIALQVLSGRACCHCPARAAAGRHRHGAYA